MKIKVFTESNHPSINGTSLKGYLNTTYSQLRALLGPSTFNKPSGDHKIQVEWVVEFQGQIFTIYDWKTYDREYTEQLLDMFHVGGKTSAEDFIKEMEKNLHRELAV
jgi:hypothetical protein